ncbi:hypothetical protein [Fulvivirga lutimaris]|uniref:hypothetical protein n=1 Tax=Fulvivirga lutimaris TaxID=1819566 RepID=UPI0012BBA278|nr:hypothetical protein [Fulvivirga lutimaris]MTI40068.1 hypothetical protein [Fulvivirga lutimaris]
MDIKKELLFEHSKPQALKISNYIGSNKNRFDELMRLFFDTKYRVTQRAAWVVSHCADKHPELIEPYIEPMILNLKNDITVAVQRNTLRVLQEKEMPDSIIGEAADICFKIMESSKEPIAVKVFAMTLLANICKKVPELKTELKILIEDQLPYGSAGFKSRANKILKKL